MLANNTPYRPVVFSLGYFRMLSPLVCRLSTPMRRFLVRFVPHAGVRRLAHLSRVMDDTAQKIFYAKKTAVLNGVISSSEESTSITQEGSGKDIMSVLRESDAFIELGRTHESADDGVTSTS